MDQKDSAPPVTAAPHQYGIATVFGGAGFVGRHVVCALAQAGYTVKVATRYPPRAYFLKPYGGVGQIVPVAVDYRDEKSVNEAVRGAQIVVNCIGTIVKKRRGEFVKAHVTIPGRIAQACAAAGVKRFVHISALGVDRTKVRYAQTKLSGEKVVRDEFPAATILRPSVIFGSEDRFFNLFAEMARYMPVMPLIGGGTTKFQPVYVGDVTAAVMAAATMVPLGDHDPRGQVYELGGPEIVDFRAIYERVFTLTRRRRKLVRVPWILARVQGRILGWLPDPPLTVDQVDMLRVDSVVAAGAKGLADLGVAATGMNAVLPRYLVHYAPGGRFGQEKQA